MIGTKRLAAAAVALATTISLTACGAVPGITVEQIPLPAPGDIGDSVSIKAEFENALNLPGQAKVRLGGTDVGEVTDIAVKNYRAIVTMNVSKKVQIPLNSNAELRQATPLGDVFVALLPPAENAAVPARDGQTLTGDGSAAATVEDLLVSITAQVDSGSVGSLQRIMTELSTAVSGNSTELAGTITGFTEAIDKFNKNAAEVDQAMATTAELTGELSDGRAQIAASINKLPPAIDAVNDQMQSILDTLDKTNTVTAATSDFLKTGKSDLIELFTHLNELLVALDTTAPKLGPMMDRLVTLVPKWVKSTSGSAATVSGKLYWLTPGAGFDSASRLPELTDVDNASESLQQTLTTLLARLTASGGAR